MERKSTLWSRLVSYKLKNNIIVVLVLIVTFFIFVGVYLNPTWRKNEVVSNVALAFVTSLLATIFAMIAEIYVKYNSHVNDTFLEDLYGFGIEKLTCNKFTYLQELLKKCNEQIWISGYRLIMTGNLCDVLGEAVSRGAKVVAVLCPPWEDGFKLVYGENEKVIDNYYKVFKAILDKTKTDETGIQNCHKIYFINKPLFSDTYKIDQNLITGPYIHNKDESNKRITANDFFSYNLVNKSTLYGMVEAEFRTLCEEASYQLDWAEFKELYERYVAEDWNEAQKIENLSKALKSKDA